MKGIILAGGAGTRLHPVTKVVSKQLLPVYDKPMIYYPLSILLLSGIKDICIISTPEDLPRFEQLFGDGSRLGISLTYIIQPSPDGLAQAFILADQFIGDDDVCLVLGDNIHYGHGISELLQKSVEIVKNERKGVVFGYQVSDPERYGVAEIDHFGNILSIEEKPCKPKSNIAVIGLYYYPNDVVQKARKVKPSNRGELEITSIHQAYLNEKRLKLTILGRGFAWLDTGTHETLIEASNFIQTIEKRQGLKVACIEEIVHDQGFIDAEQLKR